MASYELEFKQSVAKDLRSIPSRDLRKILQQIEALADDPRGPGCLKLSGLERYRKRVGVYRILYEILDDRAVVQVVKVAHRSRAYRR